MYCFVHLANRSVLIQDTMPNLNLGNSDTYMPLLALAVLIYVWRYVHGFEKKFLLLYITGSLVIFATTNILRYHKIPNLFLYHFYSWFELVVVSYFITLATYQKITFLYRILFITFTIFCIADISAWESLSKFNSNTSTAASIILLILSMLYILELTKTDKILYFQKIPAFWFVTAFLVSSALAIPLMIKYGFYTGDPKNFSEGNNLWSLMDLTYIIKFVLICAGMLCYKFYSQQAPISK